MVRYHSGMKHIVKATAEGGSIRIFFPRKMVKKIGWENVVFVTIDDRDPKKLVVRRLIERKDVDKED